MNIGLGSFSFSSSWLAAGCAATPANAASSTNEHATTRVFMAVPQETRSRLDGWLILHPGGFPRGNPAPEAKRVLRQVQIHAVVVRSDRRDLRDNHAQIVSRQRLDRRLAERQDRVDRRDLLDAGAARDRGEIGHAAGGVRVE